MNCSHLSQITHFHFAINTALCDVLNLRNISYTHSKTLLHLGVALDAVIDSGQLPYMLFHRLIDHVVIKTHSIQKIRAFGSEIMSEKIDMYYFNGAVNNWGDLLGPVLVENLTGVSTSWHRTAVDQSYLFFTVGSIIDWMVNVPRSFSWGSGVRVRPPSWAAKGPNAMQKFFSVRGPESQISVLATRGQYPWMAKDPALLVKLLYPLKVAVAPTFAMCIIPHFTHYEQIKAIYSRKNEHNVQVLEISVRKDFRQHMIELPERISTCRKVLSSSLHGLILAHSYGIPAAAVYFKGAELEEKKFKFRDHYESLGIYLDKNNVKRNIKDIEQLFNITYLESVVDSTPQPKQPIDLKSIADTYPLPVVPKWQKMFAQW